MDTLETVIIHAEESGVMVLEFRIATRLGMALMDKGRLFVAVNPHLMRGGNRLKIARVIGHEVGHCVTGSFYGLHTPLANRGQCERRAAHWYAKTVVNQYELAEYLSQTEDDYWGAADEFGVDIETILDACEVYFGVERAGLRARCGI